MEALTIGLIITIILTVGGIVWKLATYLRNIELQITNHQSHKLIAIDEKIDKVMTEVVNIKVDVAQIKQKVDIQ